MSDTGAAADLEAEYEQLLSFLYMCPAGLLQIDPSGVVRMANPLAAQLLLPLGHSPILDNLFERLEAFAPEIRNLASAFTEPRGTICANHRVFVNKSWSNPKVLSISLLRVDPDCLMAVITDISLQVKQERQLKQTESWFEAIFTGVNDFAFFSLDRYGLIEGWNTSGVRQTGFGIDEVLGRTLHCLYAPDENIRHKPELQLDAARLEGWHLDEGRCVRKDGSRYWSQSLVAALREENGEICGFSMVLRDITERRLSAAEVQRLLTTDHLTGAVNRARFFELAETEITRWHRHRRPLSAVMIDLDHFKQVNDTNGHAAGDEVLRITVERCRTVLRSFDTVARIGGEEFVILLPGTNEVEAIEIAERVRAVIATGPVSAGGRSLDITASLGCATIGDDAEDLDTLLKLADEALYRAKRLGRNRVEMQSALDTP